MRLVSKFHDYYDGVVKTTGHDKSYTFVREERQIELPGISTVFNKCEGVKNDYEFRCGLVGFCGEIYPFVEVVFWNRVKVPRDIHSQFFYAYEELVKEFPGIEGKNVSNERPFTYTIYNLSEDLKEWFHGGNVRRLWSSSITVSELSILKGLFLKERIAYFAIQCLEKRKNLEKEHTVEIYPPLKKFEFYKIFDSYTTFQKIEMFLTNDIVRPDKIDITIPDKMKAQSKGFNKWSFRKEKI